MAADAPDGANGGARKRGPFYVVIAAVFVPFLALLFPYLLLDDYRRTRSLADAGARGVTDPKRRGRERDGMFIGAGVVWVATLLGMLAARALGYQGWATALLSFQILSVVFSAMSIGFGHMARDKRTDEEKQAEFAVKEAQVQAYFDKREAQRKEAHVAFTEPAVPWVSRQVWQRWFLVRWGPHGWDGVDGGPLGLSEDEHGVGDHATPVAAAEVESAPVAEIVGDWKPRRASKKWTAAARPEPGTLDEHQAALAGLEPVALRADLITAAAMNQELALEIEDGGSKNTWVVQRTLALVDELTVDSAAASARVVCDKAGGRDSYQAPLERAFPTHVVEIVEQARRVGRYRLDGLLAPGPALELSFVMKADDLEPRVSIAACLAKYLRELSMRAFNRYFSTGAEAAGSPLPRPTAGYPQDAKRFIAEMRWLADREDLPASRWIRGR